MAKDLDLNNRFINKILVRLAKNKSYEAISKEFKISPSFVARVHDEGKYEIEKIRISMHIRNLMKDEKWEEALELCNNPEVQYNEVVAYQKVTIMKRKNYVKTLFFKI